MSVFDLPDDPEPKSMVPNPVRKRLDLSPAMAGDDLRLARPGTRWAWDVRWYDLTYEESRAFRVMEIDRAEVRLKLVQPGYEAALAALGASIVADGGGQTGAVLNVRGVLPGVTIPPVFFTIEIGGRGYVHEVVSPVTPAGTTAALPINPMLRKIVPDGAPVLFGAAYVQGYPEVPAGAFAPSEGGYVKNLTATIRERA